MYINGTEEFWAYNKQSIDSLKRFSNGVLIYFGRVVEVDPRMPRHAHGSACGSGFSMQVCRVELRWLDLMASPFTCQPQVSCNAYSSDYNLVQGCLGVKSASNYVLNPSGAWIFS